MSETVKNKKKNYYKKSNYAKNKNMKKKPYAYKNKKKNTYFDATVSSEWEFIKEQREKGVAVWYVIYRKDIEEQDKRIVLLTPEQVLVCSMPYLQSFHIKLNITKEELENPKILDGRKPQVKEKRLYDAIRRYNEIKDSFLK